MIKTARLSLVSIIEQGSSTVCIQCHVLQQKQYPDPSPFRSAYNIIAPGSNTCSTVEWEGPGTRLLLVLAIPMLATKIINDVVLLR